MTGLYCHCSCKVCRVLDAHHCGGMPRCSVPRRADRPSGPTTGPGITPTRAPGAAGEHPAMHPPAPVKLLPVGAR